MATQATWVQGHFPLLTGLSRDTGGCVYIYTQPIYTYIYIYIFINFFIVESKSLNASPGHFCGHLHCYSQRPWPLHSCVHCTYFVIIAHAYSSVSQPWNYLCFQPDNFFLVKGCPEYHSIFSSIPGFFPLDVSPFPPSPDNDRHLQILPNVPG